MISEEFFPAEIDEEKTYLIGRAFASLLPAGSRIVVGGDVRKSTPLLKEALIKGLLESGGEVVDLGVVPTPSFILCCRKATRRRRDYGYRKPQSSRI